MPGLNALFPSDGGGIPFRDTIDIFSNSNFTRFQKSLEKLSRLDVEYLRADHYGYVTGKEAGDFIRRSIQAAGQLRESMAQVYRRMGDVDEAARVMAASFLMANREYLLTPEILHGVYAQMMRHIAGAMEEKSGG